MRTLLNVLAFQIGWFASVMGAARGLWRSCLCWHGISTKAPNAWRRPLWLQPHESLVSYSTLPLLQTEFFHRFDMECRLPLSPLWMISLWLNLATILNISLKWLHGRYFLAAILGAVGGPTAYYAGARLGATQGAFGMESILVLSVAWGFAIPALFFMAKIIGNIMCAHPLPR